MSDPTTLPACERLHPGVPSGIEISRVRKNNGTTYQRRICTICRSAIASAQPRNGKTFGTAVPRPKERYGVSALSWAPPEALVAVE